LQVTDDLVRPNGIIGTMDGTRLYIADHGAGRTYVYTRAHDGTLQEKRLFVPQGSDGMAMDERGNVYLTGSDITVYNPRGESVASIAVPEPPANLTFGGPDRTTLFITARTSLYALEMAVTGQ
jgi:gluconolactonase